MFIVEFYTAILFTKFSSSKLTSYLFAIQTPLVTLLTAIAIKVFAAPSPLTSTTHAAATQSDPLSLAASNCPYSPRREQMLPQKLVKTMFVSHRGPFLSGLAFLASSTISFIPALIRCYLQHYWHRVTTWTSVIASNLSNFTFFLQSHTPRHRVHISLVKTRYTPSDYRACQRFLFSSFCTS